MENFPQQDDKHKSSFASQALERLRGHRGWRGIQQH